VLVLAKAAGLSWPTTKAILRLRKANRDMSPGEYERCAESFAGLKESIARQAIEIQRKNAPRTRFGRAVA
jgi:tRNA A37 threonylcarbamoyltransferase TsaD